jgi:ATP-binding cassette subfamily B (MDR/TAP) protein 1
VPTLAIVQAIVQRFVRPYHAQEHHHTATAAGHVERATAAIATVKAYNATAYEYGIAASELEKGAKADLRANIIWGFSAGSSQFLAMAMFVQGFWFRAKLIRNSANGKGSVSAGDVMAVIWACLIVTNSLRVTILQLITLTKGKMAMASLMNLINSPNSPDPSTQVKHLAQVLVRRRRPSARNKHRQGGQLALDNITFCYPSRLSMPVCKCTLKAEQEQGLDCSEEV